MSARHSIETSFVLSMKPVLYWAIYVSRMSARDVWVNCCGCLFQGVGEVSGREGCWAVEEEVCSDGIESRIEKNGMRATLT